METTTLLAEMARSEALKDLVIEKDERIAELEAELLSALKRLQYYIREVQDRVWATEPYAKALESVDKRINELEEKCQGEPSG